MSGLEGGLKLYGGLGLRFTRESDQEYLLDLFVSSRPWLRDTSDDRDFLRTVFEQQYRGLRASLEARYPQHLDFIVQRTGQDIGRLILDLGYNDWRVSELQLDERVRGKGVGTDLMRSLQAAAANAMVPITLAALMVSPQAQAFYARLGFIVVADNPPVVEMAWAPPGWSGSIAVAGTPRQAPAAPA
ncbi:MAG TPA: GNAT family N-acetyltransferase [Azospirillaceae bacterium]|nr:GNAT family N-acetyltransferase [Azospirillaceae bacterium]